MPEHKIVIYANGFNNGENSNFAPFSSEENDALAPFKQHTEARKKAREERKQAEETGAAALSTVSPYVAGAIAAVKVSSKVIGVVSSFLEDYAGDYRLAIWSNNWKTILSNVYNPLGMIANDTKRILNFKKHEQALQQERTLIGKTAINNGKLGV